MPIKLTTTTKGEKKRTKTNLKNPTESTEQVKT